MLLSVSSTMGIVFDVAIVAILVIFGFIGLKKGFFKSVISMLSTIVLLVISIFCAPYLARVINKIYDFTGLLAGKLENGIASMGVFYSQTIPAGMSGAEVIGAIPSSTNGFLKKLMSYVLKPLSASDIEGATVAEIVSGSFASIIMLIISAIVLFILLKIVISLVTRLFDNITRNRVFGATNKLLGLAFGVVKGFLIVIIFAFALTLLTVIPAVNTKLTPIIQDNTKIARPIYNYTDEFVEKYVIDGKVVQKWIDNLWDNKYEDRGDDTPAPTPNGTLANPYIITLEDKGTHFEAVFTINFTSNEMYYKLNASQLTAETFGLNITADVTSFVTTTTDTTAQLQDLSALSKTNEYLIKFTKNTLNQENITIKLTENT